MLMDEINLMPPEDVEKMFARLGELSLDTSTIRRKFLNCPYGEAQSQKLDIYLPNDGCGPFPVVFFIHGGAWAVGHKADNQLVPFIAGVTRGFAVVSIGYRLVPDIKYPENLFDIKAALRWTARNADTYLLDCSRTALCGASAGAHLAMMAAFTQGQAVYEDSMPDSECRIAALVNQFGPTDFTKIHDHYDQSGYPRAQMPGAPSSLDTMLGVKAEQIPNLIRFLNPLSNVHANIPPILIQHGRYDPIIPYQQAVELYEKVISIAGDGMAELSISDDLLHADPGYASENSVNQIFDFLSAHL